MNVVRMVCVSCFVLIAGAAMAAEEFKVGSVDYRLIAQNSDMGKKVTETLKKATDTHQSEIDRRKKELESLKEWLEKNKDVSAKKKEKEKTFRKKLEDYQKIVLDAEQDLRQQEEQYTKEIVGKIEKVVMQYGKDNGYAVVVKKNDLVYTDAKITVRDLSDDIMKQLNQAETK